MYEPVTECCVRLGQRESKTVTLMELLTELLPQKEVNIMMNILYEIINNVTGAESLEDLPELSMSEQGREYVTELIHNIYIEYQAFMEVSDMPEYNLYIKPQRGLELGAVKYVKGEGYNLYISDTLLKKSSMKEFLFHEFTHIYDKEYLDKVYAYRKGNNVDDRKTHVFTEIHAEQIRFLHMLGCKTINDELKNINHNTLVYSLDGKQKTFYLCLKEFRDKLMKTYFVDAQRIKSRIIKRSSIEDMVNKITYYIGALTVYQKYCDYELAELMNLSSISDFWNIDLEKLIDFYCNYDIHKPTMKTIKKLKLLIWEIF